LASGSAQAQSTSRFENGGGSVGQLVADGYEIKSVVLNNGKYIVFLQKERKAFACEFSRVEQIALRRNPVGRKKDQRAHHVRSQTCRR
jgi:hypothetical protein